MSNHSQIIRETLDDMESRHASERRALFDAMTTSAYRKGVYSQDCEDVPEAELIRIHRRVAAAKGLNPDEMQRRDRSTYLVAARWQVFYEANFAGYSLSEIGRYFNLDYTAIRNGIARHAEKIGAKK